jgi:hypothetical protein
MYATGGNEVYNHNGYRVHKFYSANNLTVVNAGFGPSATLEYMVVGGGGSGGCGIQSPPLAGGGGGAGGLAYGNVSLNGQPVAVVIGSGGEQQSFNGTPGSNSYITSPAIAGQIIGLGGGRAEFGGSGNPGGSGSGGAHYVSPTSGGSAIPFTVTGGIHYGNPGGNGTTSAAGGGGGAGGAGTTGSNGPGRTTTITGAATTWATGGGAGSGVPGTTNTGDGGGGAPQGGSTARAGGSGIVVLRYRYIPPAQYVSVTATKARIAQGSNVIFTVSTLDFTSNTLLYYTTVGNVISSDFVSGNTGSFRTTANSTVITLPTNSNIPAGQTRFFQLQIREESTTSDVKLISGNVTLLDVADPVVSNVRYLVVAGGGAGVVPSGPGTYGGGGGGGGLLQGTLPVIGNFTYVITVGAGGSDANGSNSRISGHASNVIALGGGAGGSGYTPSGYPGGSGGGAAINGSYPGQNRSGGSGTPGQGYAGGNAGPGRPGSDAGGGGGAGGPGEPGNPNYAGGHGGIGLYSDITGTTLGYAGGGGGSGNNSSPLGIGGAYNNPAYPTMDSPGFGAGGGSGFIGFFHGSNGGLVSANANQGGGGAYSTPSGGAGGSGIVVVSHPVAFLEVGTTGSPNVIYANANIIYRFWQSGTITF